MTEPDPTLRPERRPEDARAKLMAESQVLREVKRRSATRVRLRGTMPSWQRCWLAVITQH